MKKSSVKQNILILFCLASLVSYGQEKIATNDKVTLQKLHPAVDYGDNTYIFKFDENEAFVIDFGFNTYINKMKVGDEKAPKKTKIKMPEYEKKEVEWKTAFSIGKDIYMVGKVEGKNNKVSILSYKIDFNTMSLVDSPNIITTYTPGKGDDYRFVYETINDQDLLVTQRIVNKPNKTNKYSYIMLDKTFKKIWEKELIPPISSTSYKIESSQFLNENEVLLICVEFPDGERKMKKQGKPNYKYHVFYYTNKLETVQDYDIVFGENFVNDLAVGMNEEKQIICAGFYSNAGTYSMTGAFYMCIDPATKKIIKSTNKPFDNEFNASLARYWTERKAKRKLDNGEDVNAPEYNLKNLYFDSNGNVLMVAEDYWLTYTTTTDVNGNKSTEITRHYDDLIAVNISKSGEILWTTKIEKSQSTENWMKDSFITINEKGKWYFLYTEDKFPAFIVTLDETGKSSREYLLNPDSSKKQIKVANDFNLNLNGVGHIIRITNDDGPYFYKISFK